MQKKLQKYIDLLIEMCGSETNYDILKEELSEVEREIEIKKNKLKNIKKSMKDEKYLKENDRIIDENIKIGLENKKQVYQLELDKTLKLINKTSVDEEDSHQALTSVISRLKSLNALLEVLQDKLKVVNKDKNLSSFYENMIENTTKDISELEKKREILAKKYDKVRERLDYYGSNRSLLEEKLLHLDIRLKDTLEALSTPNFYVDEILKKKDEDVVDELTKELEDLENHRLVLITDPVYIGNQAMKMYLDEDYTSALSSIKELVTIVKSKPYMNEKKSELNNLLKQAEATLDEFANTMENNTYLGKDSKIVEKRIDYLNDKLSNVNKNIEEIKKQIIDIDKNLVQSISGKLKETEELYHDLKDAYEKYKKIVLNNDENISPRKKANLQTAYNNKKDEMDLVYNIFQKYQDELEEVIMKSKRLETVDLVDLENKRDNMLDEIEQLKKSKNNKGKVKDVLAMEKDKETLNNLSADVDNIKHSLKYDKKADEIYNEIESLFGHESDTPVIEEPTVDEEEFVNLDDFKIEEEPEVEPIKEEEKPVIDLPVIEQPSEDIEDVFKPDEKILKVADENLEDTKIFPPRKSSEERLKVIDVVDLPDKDEPEVLEEPIESLEEPIPTLDDSSTSEYLSFNDILNGGYNEN